MNTHLKYKLTIEDLRSPYIDFNDFFAGLGNYFFCNEKGVVMGVNLTALNQTGVMINSLFVKTDVIEYSDQYFSIQNNLFVNVEHLYNMRYFIITEPVNYN